MGKKVNPKAARLPLTKDWASRWFVSDDRKFRELLLEDAKIRRLVMPRLKTAGISKIEIERSSGKVTIIVRVSRPGMVIGRGGTGVEELRRSIEKEIGQKISLNVEEIKNPDLDAHLVASNIAESIERRYPVKRAMLQSVDRVMRAGALGVKVVCAGRLGGGEIARRQKESRGSIPTSTLRANIDFAKVGAKTATAGVVGVKVWIHKSQENKKE